MRSVSRRNWIKGTLAFGAGILVTACSQNAGEPTTQPARILSAGQAPTARPTAAAAPTAIATATAVTSPTGSTITLNVAAVKVAQKVWDDAFKLVWGDYQKQNPNVKLTIEESPFNGFDVKMLTALASGTIYDLLYGYFQWLPTWADRGVIQALDPLMKEDRSFDTQNYYSVFFETWQGKTYGIPWFVSLWLTYYNKSIFRDAGAEDPEELEKQGKWTWEAARQIAAKVSTGDGANRVYGSDTLLGNPSATIIATWAWGANFYDDALSKALFADPKFIEAIQFQVDMINQDKSVPSPSQTQQQGGPSFINGKIAAQHAGAWLNRNITEANVKFEIGQAPVPKGPGGRAVPIAQNSWYFGGKTKYPEEVWKLNSYLIGPHAQDLVVPLGQRNPVDKRIKLKLQYPFENADVYAVGSTIARPFPRIKAEAQFEKLFQTTMDVVILQQKTVKDALTELVQQTNDLIKG